MRKQTDLALGLFVARHFVARLFVAGHLVAKPMVSATFCPRDMVAGFCRQDIRGEQMIVLMEEGEFRRQAFNMTHGFGEN